MGTIYVCRNTINGKCYVGQTTIDPYKRIYQHRYGSSLLTRAIVKYGFGNFNIKFYKNIPDNFLDFFEVEAIKFYNSQAPDGYNIMSGGQKHRNHSESTKQAIANYRLGKKLSEESKAKVSKARKGNPTHGWGENQRKIMMEYLSNIPESVRKKIGDANRGVAFTEERKKKISVAKTGKKSSDETKTKLSQAWIKRKQKYPITPEYKEKLKLAQQARRKREKEERDAVLCCNIEGENDASESNTQ
jgi:group I intron endonuclease